MSDSATTEFGREYQDFEAAALELSSPELGGV